MSMFTIFYKKICCHVEMEVIRGFILQRQRSFNSNKSSYQVVINLLLMSVTCFDVVIRT